MLSEPFNKAHRGLDRGVLAVVLHEDLGGAVGVQVGDHRCRLPRLAVLAAKG